MLILDAAAAEVTGALSEGGVRSVLIKGPSVARWVYEEDEFRSYSDIDLLVAPADVRRAVRTLRGRGFDRVHSDAHAELLRRPRDQVTVDLHRLLVGIQARPEDAWGVLADQTERLALGGGAIEVLVERARALHLVLHAAQHGARDEKPLDDLATALRRLPDSVWADAANLAAGLRAEAAFETGLRLLPEGVVVANRLELPRERSVEAALRAETPPPTALGVYRFVTTPGLRAKAGLLSGELFPSAAFMRAWAPIARRGHLGLAAAYVWRPLWLLLRLGPALRAWQRARRTAR
jgi:hypothetical protein